jgi:monothiol glutaredoxin
MKMENTLFDRIRHDITDSDIVLYMKGTPLFPQDGYSAVLADVLRSFGLSFRSIDVLEEPDLYKALKEFTNWPNIPQLYIKGAFIGGSDAVKEMNASGELKKLLEKSGLLHPKN